MRVPAAAQPHQHGELITDRSAKGIQWRKDSLSTNGREQLDIYIQKIKSALVPYTEINSQSIVDLNITPKTIKLLEFNTGEDIYDFG